MKLRFQADADLNQIIVSGTVRREPSIDFQTASAAGFEGLSDSQVLERAAQEGRLLVSHDQTTMPKHSDSWPTARRLSGKLAWERRYDIEKVRAFACWGLLGLVRQLGLCRPSAYPDTPVGGMHVGNLTVRTELPTR